LYVQVALREDQSSCRTLLILSPSQLQTADSFLPQFAITSLTFGCLQLFLSILLYRNPILNPPLDAEGNPVPQDPETGAPLPLDKTGKPIEPAWLKPQPPSSVSQPSLNVAQSEIPPPPPVYDGRSDEEDEFEEEEKKLLGLEAAERGAVELGKKEKKVSRREQKERRY
jgi:hypothetical protein